MSHARSPHTKALPVASARARDARRLFFKADRPRAIDQHIDYFGGAGGAQAGVDGDLCGETLLERLA